MRLNSDLRHQLPGVLYCFSIPALRVWYFFEIMDRSDSGGGIVKNYLRFFIWMIVGLTFFQVVFSWFDGGWKEMAGTAVAATFSMWVIDDFMKDRKNTSENY